MYRRDVPVAATVLGSSVVVVLRRLAFWLAIALPVTYGPLLAVGVTDRTAPLLAGLLALNLACLVLGHEYSP